MDECAASNNSSLEKKKTWLVIETSEPQAEKEVKASAACCLRAGQCRRCGAWVDRGLGETMAPLCPILIMREALWLHDTVVGTLRILHHPKL